MTVVLAMAADEVGDGAVVTRFTSGVGSTGPQGVGWCHWRVALSIGGKGR